MGLLRPTAILLTILSTLMFIVGLLSHSTILWAGSFVVWGVGLLGYAVCRVAGKAKR
jgi:bacteriorhodopsin